ncbi:MULTISPECIES: MFS transporter [Arthrobacter]|uniref:MFS transporter n=1 Tax=Arthrobacter TaxID=1663 RepID=UPI001264BBB2|nr:MFS transporter [Arthrobacter citreus]
MSRNTLVYLGSYSLSLLGNGIASVLFPLLVLARTGDILAAGILASVTAAVAAAVGVLAGVIVDRVNRRTVSIVSDVLSAGSVAALPVVDAVWGLNLTWFIVLGVIGAFGDMPGMTARETMLPRLVQLDGGKPGALDRLVGVRESLSAALMLAGPGAGGLLVFLLGVSSTTLFITAGTSLAAAALSLALSAQVGAIAGATGHGGSPGVRGVVTDLVAGWRFLLGNRLVLGASILTAVFVAVIAGLQGAMGAPWLVIAAAVLIGLTNAPMSAVLGVATIEATPDRMRGRVLGAQNALMLAAPALTAAPIAAIASGYGLTAAGAGIAAAMAVTAVIALIVPAFQSLDTIETTDSGAPEPVEQEG